MTAAASTMSVAFHMPSGITLDIKVNRSTGDIGMTIKDPGYTGIVAVPREYAKAYVNLFRHRTDFYRARAFLAEVDKLGGVPPPNLLHTGSLMPIAIEALWLSALGATIKCFQRSESRKKLTAAQVFGADTTDPVRASFDALFLLRNQHVAHDENDWMQTVPYAIYGDAGDNKVKLGDINCVVLEGFDHTHVAQLKTVVHAACEWVTEQIDAYTEEIRATLHGHSYSDVAAMPPPPSISLPSSASIGGRKAPG